MKPGTVIGLSGTVDRMRPSATRIAYRYLVGPRGPEKASARRVASRWHPYHEYVITSDDEDLDEPPS